MSDRTLQWAAIIVPLITLVIIAFLTFSKREKQANIYKPTVVNVAVLQQEVEDLSAMVIELQEVLDAHARVS